jgi:integrase
MRFKKERSGFIHVIYQGLDGKEYSKTTGSKDMKEAKQIADAAKIKFIELAAKANALTRDSISSILGGRKITFDRALEEFEEYRKRVVKPNTLEIEMTNLRAWRNRAFSGTTPISRIDLASVDEWINNTKDTCGIAQRLQRLHSARVFFSFMFDNSYTMKNLGKLVKLRKDLLSHSQLEPAEKVPITPAEYKKIYANTEGFDRIATAFSYWTGLRLSDVCRLEWSMLTPKSELIVHIKKTGERVALPLTHELLGGGILMGDVMEIEDVDKTYCFPREREIINDAKRDHYFSTKYGRIFSRLGIEGKSFHCLRHSFATRLEAAGVSVMDIGKLIGHKSTKMTERYIHRKQSTGGRFDYHL